MARQRIHNQRAGKSTNSGASWISYSDMMAALLLVFVLILSISLYQYFTMLETKTAELETQSALLNQQQSKVDEYASQLALQQTTLDEQSAALALLQTNLDAQQAELDAAKLTLADRESLLASLQTALDAKQAELDAQSALLAAKQDELDAATAALLAQQDALTAQTAKIDAMVGVRTRIIQDLSVALTNANLKAYVDKNTGAITLDSAVLFKTNSSAIQEDGQALLNRFIPVYLNVLLQPQYADYLGEIIIEGHTDTVGNYMNNLELSQARALSVAKYCLEMPSLNAEQQAKLRSILTATGKSWSNPVYNADGTVNLDASRRVEFKFNLKDSEMIDELNRILSSGAET